MKSIKQIVKSGAMMLALSLVFTSCEDILGEWSRPAPTNVAPSGDGDDTPAPEPTPNMLETPLTLEAAVAGAKVTFKVNNNDAEKTIEYSTDGGANWTAGNTGGDGVEVTLKNVGDKVMFRGNNTTYSSDYYQYNTISCTADCYVYGNIMSLISATNFATLKALPTTDTHTFNRLFNNNIHLKNHPNAAYTLELPATTLTDSCYRYMFSGCTSLVTPPALPATELKPNCYIFMFFDCSSLTTAPELPAETLAENCYQEMFYDCSSLEKTPKLAATELKPGCYYGMFRVCTSLKEAWVKADYKAGDPDYECQYMFDGCKSGGILHTASTSTAWAPGTAMPGDWTIEKDY